MTEPIEQPAGMGVNPPRAYLTCGSIDGVSPADLRCEPEQSYWSTHQMADTAFVYTTYIAAPPDTVWKALTEPEFTREYWGVEFSCDWKVGSSVLVKEGGQEDFHDHDHVITDIDSPHRIVFSWRNYSADRAKYFAWTDDELAELSKEKRSTVSMQVQPDGEGASRLVLVHDDFESSETKMYQVVSGQLDGSGGWPAVLSNLKTLLETGKPMPISPTAERWASSIEL